MCVGKQGWLSTEELGGECTRVAARDVYMPGSVGMGSSPSVAMVDRPSPAAVPDSYFLQGWCMTQ